MSTPFNSEWLKPGAAVEVSIDNLAAYHAEVQRLMKENSVLRADVKQWRDIHDAVVKDADKATEGIDFSNTKPTGCLPRQKHVMPRWVAVFEEEAKKPLSVIGLKRDDIKQAARDYKLMQDLYEGVATIRDAAVRILAEAQGQETSVLFEPLNLQTLSSCIDHHAAELFRLRAKVQKLEALLERKQ